MPSTAIRTIDYDDEQRRLFVTFMSGRSYVYDRVPPEVHEAFVTYPSKGAFFNRYIRDRYRHREIVQAS